MTLDQTTAKPHENAVNYFAAWRQCVSWIVPGFTSPLGQQGSAVQTPTVSAAGTLFLLPKPLISPAYPLPCCSGSAASTHFDTSCASLLVQSWDLPSPVCLVAPGQSCSGSMGRISHRDCFATGKNLMTAMLFIPLGNGRVHACSQ